MIWTLRLLYQSFGFMTFLCVFLKQEFIRHSHVVWELTLWEYIQYEVAMSQKTRVMRVAGTNLNFLTNLLLGNEMLCVYYPSGCGLSEDSCNKSSIYKLVCVCVLNVLAVLLWVANVLSECLCNFIYMQLKLKKFRFLKVFTLILQQQASSKQTSIQPLHYHGNGDRFRCRAEFLPLMRSESFTFGEKQRLRCPETTVPSNFGKISP